MMKINDLEIGKEYYLLNDYECCEGWGVENVPEKMKLISIEENENTLTVNFEKKSMYFAKKDYKGKVVKRESMDSYIIFPTKKDMFDYLYDLID